PPQLGVSCSIVQANKDLVLLNDITLLGRDLTDDAALEVLDQLVLSGGHELAGGDDRTVQGSYSGPNTETTEPSNQDNEATDDRPFGAQRNIAIPLADAALFPSHAVLPSRSPVRPEGSERRGCSGFSPPDDRTRR